MICNLFVVSGNVTCSQDCPEGEVRMRRTRNISGKAISCLVLLGNEDDVDETFDVKDERSVYLIKMMFLSAEVLSLVIYCLLSLSL